MGFRMNGFRLFLATLFLLAVGLCGSQVDARAASCAQEPFLRSESGRFPVTVTFVNRTKDDVRLWWLDYTGQRKLYATLKPGSIERRPTFYTHPWIVTTAKNGECLLAIESDFFPSLVRIGPPDAPVEPSWEHAYVFLDGLEGRMDNPAIAKALSALNERRPVVIHLHGCSNHFANVTAKPDSDFVQGRLYRDAGFITIMPDSFAREGRIANCPGDSFPEFDRYRQEEIRYALDRLRSVNWAAMGMLVLSGQREGGYASARWKGAEFRAAIIAGWNCNDSGILLPPSVSVLIIESSVDPEYKIGKSCALELRRHGALSQIIDTRRVEPSSLVDEQVQSAVLQFLHAIGSSPTERVP